MNAAADHRPRVAAERRDRMCRHLMQSALHAMVARGTAALPLDAVLDAAGVSRATFYKYFADVPAVVQAMGVALSDELIAALDPLVKDHDDPAARLSCGLHGGLLAVQALPALGLLLAHTGWPAVELGPQHALHRLVGADLVRGMNRRRFVRMDLPLALELLTGTMLAGVARLSAADPPADLVPQVVAAALRQLGLDPAEARRLAKQPVTLPVPAAPSWLASLIRADDPPR